MTTFNIISVGDVEFLAQILNAVASVCGTGDFKQLCVCGFIVGLLFIGFQCIFQGAQRINLQHTLVCVICWFCFFGPSCTVTVEDARGSTYTRVVDNVPMGVGVAGMAISGIGYGLMNLLEQAYGTTDRTSNYTYIEPLKVLADLRTAAYSEDLWPVLDAQCGAGCDTRQALVNYLSECTAKAVQIGYIKPTALREADFSGTGIDNFSFSNNAYMTYLPLVENGALVGADNDGYVTCAEGWSKIKTHVLNKISTAAVATRLNALINNKEYSADGASKTVSTSWTKISDSFQLLGITSSTAQDFMKAAVVDNVMAEANQKFMNSQQDYQTAITINQALVQRDTQWAGEQTMFVSVSRAIMAFFEGFVYAVTPLVGFFLMIGAFGLGLVGKYFMVLAWIQLWLPCMSICNLYTMTGARSAISTYNASGASFYAIDSIYAQVSHWVAVGGMLFGATPMLSLFMISGSMYAFTTLATRLQGQDHFNEKNITPDAVQVGAVQAVQSLQGYNRYQGALASGAKEIMPGVQDMANVTRAVAGAEARVNAEQESFAANWVKSGGLNASFGESNAISETVGKEVGAVRVAGNSTVKDVVDRTLANSNYTAEQKNAVMGKIGLTMQVAQQLGETQGPEAAKSFLGKIAAKGGAVGMVLGALGFSEKIAMQGDSSNTDEASSGTGYSEGHSSGEGATRAANLMSSISHASKAGLSNVSANQWQNAAAHTDNRQLSDSYNKMGSTVRSYTDAKMVAEGFNASGGGRSLNTMVERMTHTQEGLQKLHELQGYEQRLKGDGEKATFAKDVNEFAKMIGNGVNPTQGEIRRATAMAALNHMLKNRNYSELAKTMGTASLPSTRAEQMDLSDPQKVKGASGRTAQKRAQAQAEINAAKATIDLAGESPKASFDEGVAEAEKQRAADKAAVREQGGRDAGAVTHRHKAALLETLNKDSTTGGSLGIWIGKNLLNDAIPLAPLRKFLDSRSPAQAPNEGKFEQYVTHHKQQLFGLSRGELNYLNHYYDMRHNLGFDKDDDKELSGTAKRLAVAREELKEEMKQHIFGKNYDAKRDEATLNKYVDGMTMQLEKLNSLEAQGYATKVLDFNRTFHVKAAPTQKIS